MSNKKMSPARELVRVVGDFMLSPGNEPIEIHLVSCKHPVSGENILEVKIVLMNEHLTRDFVKVN